MNSKDRIPSSEADSSSATQISAYMEVESFLPCLHDLPLQPTFPSSGPHESYPSPRILLNIHFNI
jgi:hypothetical protein